MPTHINSIETLDHAAGELVRRRIALTQARAAMEAAQANIEKRFEAQIQELTDECAELETAVREYTEAHRSEVLGDKKSRETPLCTFGFRLSTRVEPANRRIKWGEVVERLTRCVWGGRFLRFKAPDVNKQALLDARDILDAKQLDQAGIRFVSEDNFYLDPKPETAAQV